MSVRVRQNHSCAMGSPVSPMLRMSLQEKEAPKTGGYPNWAFIKSAKGPRATALQHQGIAFSPCTKCQHTSDPATLFEKKLVHPKDKTPTHKMSNVVQYMLPNAES